jgi:osmotically-inducible protein OsmY
MNVPKHKHRFRWLTAGLAFALVCASGSLAAQNKMSDTAIRDAVEKEIIFDPAVRLNDIDVMVDEQIVTLRGTVDNHLTKDWAENLASTIKGVRSVVNLIDVKPAKDISAEALTRQIQKALLEDPATDAYEVNVSADDQGSCKITGTVDSWKEKQLVERVAKGVNGVTDINNAVTVKYKGDRPDVEIRPEITKSLRWDSLIDDAMIDVAVANGDVTLSGTVGSAAEKRRAIAASWVAGVKSVDANELNVARWARDDDLRERKYVAKSDRDIRDAVKDALAYDPRVLSFNVTPEVEYGAVTLRGTVDNLKAKRAAELDARNTVGVSTVHNRLKVEPAMKLADAAIKDKVTNALKRDVHVDAYEITTSVSNGVAHLYGTVDTYFDKAQADDAASRVNGVEDVRNHLVVTNPTTVAYDPYVYTWYPYTYYWYHPMVTATSETDAEIKDDIQDELWWSPFVDSDDINVKVKDGKATLTGTVDSYSELDAARENAYEGGAINVVCDLTVGSQGDMADSHAG